MRVGPEELLVVSDDSSPPSHERVAALRRQLPANIGSVLDLSHARCRIRIEGEHAVDMLGKLYALDFREHAFPVGRVQLTGHHHVPCALHRTGPASFDAYVFTTYARDQLETFADAALEYGVRAISS
jgi:heterotetrameric sarcosine oxidase gamma subunit